MFDILYFLLVGLAAGWLASKIMKGSGSGLLTNLVVGVVGAILGGLLFGLLGLTAWNIIGQLLTATVGAILFILILRQIGPRV